MKMRILWIVVAMAATSSSMSRADDTTQVGAGVWSFFLVQSEIFPRLRTSFETHLRSAVAPAPAQLTVLQLTPALGLEFLSHASFWFAYSRFEGLPSGARDENRIWQQFVYDVNPGSLRALFRVRVEERFFTDVGEILLRLRLLIRTAFSLVPSNRWQAVAQNELFLHLNSISTGPLSGFDQNRIQWTLQYQTEFGLTLDLGYQLQYQLALNAPNRLSHNLVLLFNWRLKSEFLDLGTQE